MQPTQYTGAAFLLLLSVDASAEVPGLTVTATRLPEQPVSGLFSSTVITDERLDERAGDTLLDVLQTVPGFSTFRRGDARNTNPTSDGATFRGLGANAAGRVLVTVDGVPQDDPFGGWVPWPALLPHRFESVRVMRGGGSGPFGAGALAGTVDIRAPVAGARPLTMLGIEAGSRQSVTAVGSLDRALGSGGVRLDGRYARSDGYVLATPGTRGAVDSPADWEQWAFSAGADVAMGDRLTLSASALVFADERSGETDLIGSGTDGRDASLRLTSAGDWPWGALVYLKDRAFDATFAAIDDDRATASIAADQFSVPSIGLGGRFDIQPPLGRRHSLQLGFDARHADGSTSEFGRNLGSGFTRLRVAGGEQSISGAFLEYGYQPSDELLLAIGLRVDRWTQRGGFRRESDVPSGAVLDAERFDDRSGWEETLRGGISYDVTGAIEVRAAGYRGFRLPTLNELYRPFRVGADATAANEELGIERLSGGEVGIRYEPLGTLSLAGTIFWNELRNAIANVPLASGPGVFPGVGFVGGGGVYAQRLNLDSVEAAGVELDASIVLGSVSANLAYAFTDAEVQAAALAPQLEGLRPPQVPRHQIAGRLGYSGAFDASADIRYVSNAFDDDLNTAPLGDAVTIDARVAVPLGQGLSLTARADNLLDASVINSVRAGDARLRDTPRTLWLGLRWTP